MQEDENLTGQPIPEDPAPQAPSRDPATSPNLEKPKQTAQPKPKKPLTKEQKWWRFHGMQASLFAGIGALAALVLVLIVCVVTLPFRGRLTGSEQAAAPSAAPAESILEEDSAEPEPSPSPTPQVSTVSLMAVGDNLIHSTVYEFAQQEDGTYDFTEIYSQIKDDLSAADLNCIQQETIFVDDPSLYSNYPCFGTPAEMADSLAQVGFNVVCHASNHTLDMGSTGLEDTFAAWKKHPEVTVLGIHESQAQADEIQVVEKNGIQIAMLDYTYGLNGYVPENDWDVDLLDQDHKDRIVSQVDQAVGMSDITIVFMHNGDEGQFTVSEDQEQWAQLFADHGVGLVIGTHPHVVQKVDLITGENGNKMPIFYSLGNFVSSQRETQNMVGGMAKVQITKDDTGTYVSEYNIEPLVTLIQGGGTVGTGYRFHTYHMENYTDELAATHIRDNCSREDVQAVWDTVFGESSTGTDDPIRPLASGAPATSAATETNPEPSQEAGTVTSITPEASPSPSSQAA